MIRKAVSKDIKKLQRLINYYANKELMLPRTSQELCENLRDFWVFVDSDRVLGCVALHIYSDNLAEIKSLAVDGARQGQGIGSQLLKCALIEAKALGIKEVFALTLARDFFKRFSFKAIDKEKLPQKIWGECIKCAKFTRCDEVAFIKRL